jgi:hypothetical protein
VSLIPAFPQPMWDYTSYLNVRVPMADIYCPSRRAAGSQYYPNPRSARLEKSTSGPEFPPVAPGKYAGTLRASPHPRRSGATFARIASETAITARVRR